jgi:S-(hydroxymethyl)glutathione dehydrogenase/alcohol dehydrogenase
MTVVIGIMKGDLSAFAPFEFLSEKVLTGYGGGSLRMSIDIPNLVMLCQTGVLKLDELITARYPLEHINEAIESLEKGESLRNLIVF